MKGASDAIAAIAQRRTQSLTAIVRDELERMIVAGELRAGERLNEQVLATRLGVSRGPIREATRALERAGLVTSMVNHGFFVRQIETEEAIELYDMRALLFGFACARLASEATIPQKAALRTLVAEMDGAIERADTGAYYEMNLRFHDTVMAFAGHSRASQIYASLVKESHLFRQRSLLSVMRMRESNREHATMLDAIEAGDPVRARHEAEQHHFGGKRRWLETMER